MRNKGTVVDQFDLDLLGDVSAWTVVEPRTLRLFPEQEEVATVTFRPPRSSEVQARTIPFGVRVRSSEDPGGSVAEEGALEVQPFREALAELVPRTSRGSWRAVHELAVDNGSNVRLDASLSATDPDNLLRFAFRPPQLVAEPGTASFAKLIVGPRKPVITGVPQTRPFKVTVKSEGQAPLTVDGTMLQEPVVPRWAPKAALTAIGLIVACVALWLGVLRPGIQSAARDAVAAPLAQQSSAIANLQKSKADKAGGGANPAGGASASPAASPPAGSPAPGGMSSLGNPVDGRLVLGSSTFAVPSSGQLSVTDTVFENPNADSGSIRVLRGNSVLWVLNLDNFRDLDYHFVAPITFNKGEKFTVDLSQCKSASSNRQCTASLYYNGFLKAS